MDGADDNGELPIVVNDGDTVNWETLPPDPTQTADFSMAIRDVVDHEYLISIYIYKRCDVVPLEIAVVATEIHAPGVCEWNDYMRIGSPGSKKCKRRTYTGSTMTCSSRT